MAGADLTNADLTFAAFRGANFNSTNLRRVRLHLSTLHEANLINCRNLITFGPIGDNYETGTISVSRDDEPLEININMNVYGDEGQAINWVRSKYGFAYEKMVSGACAQARDILRRGRVNG